ncbi:MAG TPA: hypothetical protein VFU07_05175 [Candidatus Lumbricidophila sp.]|nr:hypothetical protein [Candidatus Lumbricidophila sp.]
MATASTPKGASDRAHGGLPRRSVKILLHPDTVERGDYWAAREGLSRNEYMALAVEEKIARANGDYDLPVLEIQRLNQLIDEIKAISTNITNLETVTVSGFDSLLGLTRGDSYLLDAEEGELDVPGEPAFDDVDVVSDGFGGAW